jgi:hypothetical protein
LFAGENELFHVPEILNFGKLPESIYSRNLSMENLFESIDLNKITDTGLELGINALLAIATLIIGMWR